MRYQDLTPAGHHRGAAAMLCAVLSVLAAPCAWAQGQASVPVTVAPPPNPQQRSADDGADGAVDDPAVAAALASLKEAMTTARQLDDQGRFQEAEPLWRKALLLREPLVQGDPVLMAQGKAHLAHNLEAQGRFGEAEPLRRSARDLLITSKGDVTTEDIADAYTNLGYNLTMQGHLTDGAVEAYGALGIWRSNNKGETLPAAYALNVVGLSLDKQGHPERAEPFYRRALEIRQRELGEHDLDTATSYNNLAVSLSMQGKPAEADPLFRRAIAIREADGKAPALVAENAFNIAANLDKLKKWPEAEARYREAIGLWARLYGADNVQTASGYNGLGMSYFLQGRHDEAEPLFVRALNIREKAYGLYNPDVAESYGNIAMVRRARGDEKGAQALLKKVADIDRRTIGSTHPDTIAIDRMIEH